MTLNVICNLQYGGVQSAYLDETNMNWYTGQVGERDEASEVVGCDGYLS